MRRPFVISTGALALALLPAALSAQTPPAQPAQQPAPAAAPAAQDKPAEPKLGFTTPAGMLLVQVKPDQTAAFDELSTKLKTAASGWKIYKASEGMQGNALYVVVVDPAVAGTEYNPIDVLYKTMTDEQKRAPETQEMFKRFAAAFAGVNKLNITKVGGM